MMYEKTRHFRYFVTMTDICSRLREMRNRLHHIPHNELSDAEFEDMWRSTASSLRKLGSTDQQLDEIRSCDLDPEKTKMCALALQQQALSEQCKKLEKEVTHKHWLLAGFLCLLALLLIASATIIVFIVHTIQPQSCEDNAVPVPTSKQNIRTVFLSSFLYQMDDVLGCDSAVVTVRDKLD